MSQLTPEKERLLNRLNEEARLEWEKAADSATKRGRPLPPDPVVLEPEHMEYPKALYSPSGEVKLVKNQHEHKNLGASWAESPHPKKG